MDFMWSFVAQVFWSILSVLWWLLVKIFWLLLWTALPVIVLAFCAIRLAEYLLGKAVVRAWLRRHSLKYGKGTWRRTHRAFFALGSLPVRVLGWLVVYGLWHSILSLFWTPHWSPWQRAWNRRWHRRPTSRGKQTAADTN